jgi:flagellar FliL protein
MATTEQVAEAAPPPAKPNRRRRLLLLGAPVLLAGAGAGLWFSGLLPAWLHLRKDKDAAGGHAEAAPRGAGTGTENFKPPPSLDLPEMVANLSSAPGRRSSYIKLHARIELARAEDVAVAQAGVPRLLDMFQTYLREMRPEELHGSVGTWRLREELIARANVAIAPARVTDVLFTELLVQ